VASKRPPGIHTILSLEPRTSALIWPTPVTVDDLRSERLLTLRDPLGSPPVDRVQLYIEERGEDESGYFLHEEQSRAFYDWELTDTDHLWPMTFLRLDGSSAGTPRFTLALHKPSTTLWECALTLYMPQVWTPELLLWVFARHVNMPALDLIDWSQATHVLNAVR
jgi:hypothetical protein